MAKDDLTEIQRAYSLSCEKYEQAANKLLTHEKDLRILSSWGCALQLKGDALHLFPGKSYPKQLQKSEVLYRGTHQVKRILIVAESGLITLGAMRWCRQQDITILVIDPFFTVLVGCFPPESVSDVTLRRAQYRALDNGLDVHIAREILRLKLVQQIALVKTLPDHLVDTARDIRVENHYKITHYRGNTEEAPVEQPLEDFLSRLDDLRTISALQALEGTQAREYWSLLTGIPLFWQAKDKKRVPEHWLSIGRRLSSLADNRTPQRSANVFHACLNYCYAILEGQCRIAALKQGFDPAAGVLHVNTLSQDNLVYDLMEVHRPRIDDLLLQFFRQRKLSKGDFMGTNNGTIQFNPHFSRFLAASCRLGQDEIDASATWLKNLFLA